MPDKPRNPSLNLEDIARLSGVSRSTVSRVVNNSPNVREDTRERVLEVIRKHKFTPNLAARALVTQRTQVIGMYVPYFVSDLFSDPYFPVLIQALTSRANEQNYDVMLWLRGPDASPTHLHQRVLDNRMSDGLCISSAPESDTLADELIERGRTFVLIGRPWRHEHVTNYIDTENYQGSQQAIEHLMRLGRRRIAHIAGRLDVISGYDRMHGYRDALTRLGLDYDESLVVEGDFSDPSGYIAMRQLLPQRPDAVFVASDRMALGALRALNEAGIRVPDDIALVGFDDMPFATLGEPQLTTVRQSVTRLGQLAAEGLIGLIEGTITPPYQVVLPTQLVIRTSCGFAT